MFIALTTAVFRVPLLALAKVGFSAVTEGVRWGPKSIRTGRGTYRAFRTAGGWRVVSRGRIWRP